MLLYQPDILEADFSFYQCSKKPGGGLIYPDFFKPSEKGVKNIKLRLAVCDYYIDPGFKVMYEGFKDTGLYTVEPYVVYAPARYDGGPLADAAAQVHYALDAWDKMNLGPVSGIRFTGDYELTRGRSQREISGGVVRYHGLLEYYTGVVPSVYTRASWWDYNVTPQAGEEIATEFNLHTANYRFKLESTDGLVSKCTPSGKPAIPRDWRRLELKSYEWQFAADKPPNNMGPALGVRSPNVDLSVLRMIDVTEPVPGPAPLPKKKYRVIADAVNVRTGPGTEFTIKTYLGKGDVVEVIDEIVTTKWIRHGTGWSAANYEGEQWMEEV